MDAHYHSFIADLEALEAEIRAGFRRAGLITASLAIGFGVLIPETLARLH